MQYFPIFMAVDGRAIAVAGGGEIALAKIRLLLKSTARLTVYAEQLIPALMTLVETQQLRWEPRRLCAQDLQEAVLCYAASGCTTEDARCAELARAAGVPVNCVDQPALCDFLTPAIVDRDPVVIAIGTEGTAPVLARQIKAHLEALLPSALGALARAAGELREQVTARLGGRARREFWAAAFADFGRTTLNSADREGFATTTHPQAAQPAPLQLRLAQQLQQQLEVGPQGARAATGQVDLVGAGPGDPALLTLQARALLHEAEVVIHDRLVSAQVLELCRREALLIDAGKTGFGPSLSQQAINALMVEHALAGRHVLRLKAGDPCVFGRLDEEIDACTAAGIPWRIVPGITAAAAAAAQIGQSLTRRGRNSAARLLTGHDCEGFSEHDWRTLASGEEVAAIYMGKRAARWIQGRLLMHGASPQTPVTVVENASRADSRVLCAPLDRFAETLTEAGLRGPALILYGLAPRAAHAALGATARSPHTVDEQLSQGALAL